MSLLFRSVLFIFPDKGVMFAAGTCLSGSLSGTGCQNNLPEIHGYQEIKRKERMRFLLPSCLSKQEHIVNIKSKGLRSTKTRGLLCETQNSQIRKGDISLLWKADAF